MTVLKVTAILATVGSFGLWLGVSDASTALTFGGRLEGAVLLAASAVVLAGAVAATPFQRGSPRAGRILISGAIFARTLAGLLLLVALIQPYRRSNVIGFLAATLALTGWVVFKSRRAGIEVPYPRSIAASIVVPSVIALLNIVYADVYLPSVEPHDFEIKASLAPASQSDDKDWAYVLATIDLK